MSSRSARFSPAANWAGAVAFLIVTIVGVVGIATCEDPAAAAAAAAADDDGLLLAKGPPDSVSPPVPPQSYFGFSPRAAGTLMRVAPLRHGRAPLVLCRFCPFAQKKCLIFNGGCYLSC